MMPTISKEAMIDIQERMEKIKQGELSVYSCPNYISTEEMATIRQEVITYFYSLVDYLELTREIVSITAFIMDRYISQKFLSIIREETALHHDIRLIGLVCFYIAFKSHVGTGTDMSARIIPIEKMLLQYPKDFFIKVEMEILSSLEWKINYPTPVSIARDLLPIIPCPISDKNGQEFQDYIRRIDTHATYISEVAVVDHGFIQCTPSSIALSALIVAIEIENSLSRNHDSDPLCHFQSAIDFCFGDIGLSCRANEVQWCRERFLYQLEQNGYIRLIESPSASPFDVTAELPGDVPPVTP